MYTDIYRLSLTMGLICVPSCDYAKEWYPCGVLSMPYHTSLSSAADECNSSIYVDIKIKGQPLSNLVHFSPKY